MMVRLTTKRSPVSSYVVENGAQEPLANATGNALSRS